MVIHDEKPSFGEYFQYFPNEDGNLSLRNQPDKFSLNWSFLSLEILQRTGQPTPPNVTPHK